MFREESGKLSFSRIWGAALGAIVLGVYVFSFVLERDMPGLTLPLLIVGLGPYLGKQGSAVALKVLDIYKGKK